MTNDNIIRIASRPSDLTGEGTEYLSVDGFIIAKFYNGNMPIVECVNVDEPTRSVA